MTHTPVSFTDLHMLITSGEETTILVVSSKQRETFLRNAFRAHPLFSGENADCILFKNGAVIRFTRPVDAA